MTPDVAAPGSVVNIGPGVMWDAWDWKAANKCTALGGTVLLLAVVGDVYLVLSGRSFGWTFGDVRWDGAG